MNNSKVDFNKIYQYIPFCLKSGQSALAFGLEDPLIKIVDNYNVMNFVEGNTSAKIILYPISDLNNKIFSNKESFIPLNRLNDIITLGDTDIYKLNSFIKSPWTYYFLPHLIIEKLFEWKFDIYSLIENDLAIDVNTLKDNPYK